MSLAKVQEAYKAYQDIVHSLRKKRRDERKELLDELDEKYPEGFGHKFVSSDVFEVDDTVKKLRKFYKKKETDYQKIPEYINYLRIRNDEIDKRYVYKASNGVMPKVAIEEVAKELELNPSVVEIEIRRFNRNKIPKYKYVLVHNRTGRKCYCTNLEDVVQFCKHNKVSYEDVINGCGDYELTQVPLTSFKEINRGNAFIYEGILYLKNSSNFFACL